MSIRIDKNKLFSAIGLAKRFLRIPTTKVSGGVDLPQLMFRLVKTSFRPNILVHKISIFHDDFMEIFLGIGLYSKIVVSGSSPSYTIQNSVMIVTNNTGGSSEEYLTTVSPSIPVLALRLKVVSHTATLGSNQGNAAVTLVKDAGNRFLFSYDTLARKFSFYRVVAGSGTEVWSYTIDLLPPYQLIMILVGKVFMFFYEKDGVIAYLGSYKETEVDFLDPAVLQSYSVGFGQLLSNGVSITYDEFEYYIPPGLGLRDLTLVVTKDNAPVIFNNKVFLLATSAGLDIDSAYATLWSLDLRTYEMRLEAVIVTRDPSDGKLYTDQAGQIVYDEDTNEYICAISSWGRLYYKGDQLGVLIGRTKTDLLNERIIILDASRLSLPLDTYQFDPWLYYDKDAGVWRIAYTSPFERIVIAENKDITPTGWSLVSYLSVPKGEGPKMAVVNGKRYVLFRCGDVSPYMCFADYPTLTNRGSIKVDKPATLTSHPMIIPIPYGETTKYILVAFDVTQLTPDYWSHGSVLIYEADQKNPGYEYDIALKLA